jgi:hypothetical protein
MLVVSTLVPDVTADVGSLVAAVRPSDTLLAVGSLVNGLGSSSTELDLLLLGTGAPSKGVSATVSSMSSSYYRVASGRTVKVRFCSDDELYRIAETVDHFSQALIEPSAWANLPHLDEPTQVLLHELRNGIVLTNASIAQSWRETLRVDELHLYVATLHLLRYAARRRSVFQQLQDGDPENARWMLVECLEAILAGALAAAGETNPRRRWHLRLARRLDAGFQAAGVARVIDMIRMWPSDDTGEAVAAGLAVADELRDQVLHRCPQLSMLKFLRNEEQPCPQLSSSDTRARKRSDG